MRKVMLSGLCLLSLCGCGAAPSDGADDGASAPTSVAASTPKAVFGEGTALLAQVDLSPTHVIGFYQGAGLDNFVFESYSIDNDRPALKGQELVENGHYADLYQRLAGAKADAAALSRLQQLDQDALLMAAASPELGSVDTSGDTPATGPAYSATSEAVAKDFWSDADWFRNAACGGCVGDTGNRQGFGEPSSWPTCTNSPEVCEFFGSGGTSTVTRKSKNFDFFTSNFAFSGNEWVEIYLAKREENCSFWTHVVTMTCGWGGTQIARVDVPPRTSWGMVGTNPSTSWTRAYEVTPPENVGFKLDIW